MVKYCSLLILCTLQISQLFAQHRIANYYFEGNLKEFTGVFIPLEAIGTGGTYSKEVVEKLGKSPRQVFYFKQNEGLVFDNSKLENFITDSYAIEMYFKYDNGSLLLYNQLLGDKLNLKQGKFVHLVMTRDHISKRVLVYLDGEKQMEFKDTGDQLEMGVDRQITFFVQDGVQTTSGAVAMIKIYNYFIDIEEAEEVFGTFKDSQPITAEEPQNAKDSQKINNLFFVQSSSKLLPESNPSLDKLVEFLSINKNINVELRGHTDNQGDYQLNLQLSKERAEAVKSFCVAQGINSKRIKTKGFGGTRPVASNGEERTRKLNRRVEMIIL